MNCQANYEANYEADCPTTSSYELPKRPVTRSQASRTAPLISSHPVSELPRTRPHPAASSPSMSFQLRPRYRLAAVVPYRNAGS